MFDELHQKDGQKRFVIYIKFGCHWPYLLNFDSSKPVFTPIQQSTATPMTKSNKQLIVNTYLNSIYYNVDHFMKRIVENVNPSENFVFYTSDHGQSILEKDISRTHCSSNVDNIPRSEFDVPLILYSTQLDHLKESRGYSQIQIFPTTLNLMGYNESVHKGVSIMKGKARSRSSFITGTGKLFEFN